MSNDRRYEGDFLALRRGEVTFTMFVRRTDKLWRRLAAQIRRRWAHPPWHAFEDTMNDLLLGAWEFVPKFDEARGGSMQRYVVWNAYDRAKKACHKARGASHSRPAGESDNPDRARSRVERPLSSYGEEGSDEGESASAGERLCFAHGVFTVAVQEIAMLGEEERADVSGRIWAYAESFAEMTALEVLAEVRSVDEAAARLYETPASRRELRLRDEGHARDFVSRLVRAVSARMAATAGAYDIHGMREENGHGY